jgi:uncharacterized protein (DUF1501 family)
MRDSIRSVSKGVVNLQRREFLRRSSLLSMTGIAAPLALHLAALGEAAAAETVNDYKALVCVFLYGANDHANTYVPYDTSNYATYASIRAALTTAKDQLLPLTPTVSLPSGMQMAFAPQWTGLRDLFDAGKLGVQLNVGPLIVPTTLAQYKAQSVPLPPKLFSHNDQQSVWQSSLAEGATTGWGGRMGDLFLSNNSTTTFTCMNVSGNAVFMSGQQTVAYQVSSTGAVKLKATTGSSFGSSSVSKALQTLTQASTAHYFESEHAKIMKRAVEAEQLLTAGLAAAPTFTTAFNANNSLATQLQMVAKTIAARQALGTKRQVFFVSLGGFDLHDNLVDQHPGLLTAVSEALSSFYAATVELGVADKVTTFTASDFGRTLTSNGDGSDHGWGSHHVVMGGAVSGKRFYGTAPVTAVNGPDDVGQGRLLPTTSVDQFGAALATWFGVPASEIATVFPNINNFNQGTLPIFG